METLLRLDRKITVRECSLSKEINQNQSIGYKSSIFQLQISSNLYVSPMRYVGNITNPVISDTYSIAFLLIQKCFWPCPLAYWYHAPLKFSNSLSFSHWIELKHLVTPLRETWSFPFLIIFMFLFMWLLHHATEASLSLPIFPQPSLSSSVLSFIHRSPFLNEVRRLFTF